MSQTLSNTCEMSRKIPLTSTVGLLPKAVCISCIIDSNWAILESSKWPRLRTPTWQENLV